MQAGNTANQQLATIRRLLAARKYAEADQAARQLRTLQPGLAEAWFYGGVAAMECGNHSSAVELLQQATRLDPKPAAPFAQLARALVLTGHISPALEAARSAIERQPRDALSLDTLGVVFSHAGCHDEAAEVFRRAVAAHPENANFQHNLGMALKFCGDLQGAATALQQALTLQPALARVRFALAHLQQWSDGNNHIASLEAQLSIKGLPPAERLYLGHALAKELDDIGRCDEAFAVLTEVNAVWRRQHPYDPESDAQTIAALMRDTGAGPAVTRLITKSATTRPIFIVGMPRTGTTLVERILSSHSAIATAGELPFVPQLAHQLSGSPSRKLLDAVTATCLPAVDSRKFRDRYTELTRRFAGDAACLVDKLPVNFLYTGLLLRSFPDAHIICLRRNALDTCLSNFRQLFALDNPFYGYAFDLLDTGRYYLLFNQLMAHWQRQFPGRILEVHYEAIVNDQEGQSRALIERCGLPWEVSCLTFERNSAPVATASSAQVREPLYSSSVARWQRYDRHLGPLKTLLRAGGIAPD